MLKYARIGISWSRLSHGSKSRQDVVQSEAAISERMSRGAEEPYLRREQYHHWHKWGTDQSWSDTRPTTFESHSQRGQSSTMLSWHLIIVLDLFRAFSGTWMRQRLRSEFAVWPQIFFDYSVKNITSAILLIHHLMVIGKLCTRMDRMVGWLECFKRMWEWYHLRLNKIAPNLSHLSFDLDTGSRFCSLSNIVSSRNRQGHIL